MATSVTYTGDVVETSLKGRYELVLTVTPTGVYTFRCLVQLRRKATSGSMTWNVTNSHEVYLYYRGTGDSGLKEHALGLAGTKVYVPNALNAVGTIGTYNITINSACTDAQRVIAAHYYAHNINGSDTYNYWAPSKTSPGSLPSICNTWVYVNGAWKRASQVWVYNGGWKKSSTGGLYLYNGGWKS